VDDCDVEVAMELMNFVLFHEIGSDAETPVASDVSALKGKFGKDVDANNENRINLGATATQTSVYDDVASEGETLSRTWASTTSSTATCTSTRRPRASSRCNPHLRSS
jgi:hypothetical protein